jgi:uroporphyrinogen-III synthase
VRIVYRPVDAGADAEFGGFDWLACTSRHAVEALAAAVAPRPLHTALAAPDGTTPRVAAVGRATAAALRAHGLTAGGPPGDAGDAAALAERLVAAGVGVGTRVLFPRAAGARDALPMRLRAAGAVVVDPVLYDTLADAAGARALADALAAGAVDVVTLASPSAVQALAAAVDRSRLARARLATIGATTSNAVRALGLSVAAQATTPDARALAAAVARLW